MTAAQDLLEKLMEKIGGKLDGTVPLFPLVTRRFYISNPTSSCPGLLLSVTVCDCRVSQVTMRFYIQPDIKLKFDIMLVTKGVAKLKIEAKDLGVHVNLVGFEKVDVTPNVKGSYFEAAGSIQLSVGLRLSTKIYMGAQLCFVGFICGGLGLDFLHDAMASASTPHTVHSRTPCTLPQYTVDSEH